MTITREPSGAMKVLAGLLEARTGQVISANRFWRIETALKPVMRQHGIPDLDALVAVLLSVDSDALQRDVIEAMLNNESSFFRDVMVFSLLKEHVLPYLAAHKSNTKRLRIWSSGCSTGQEPYSLAMLLAEESFRWAGWTIEIVASDISGAAIDYARQGIYNQFEIQRGLSVERMLRHFRQDGTRWQINSQVRSMVSFREDNLLDHRSVAGTFDLVLCRNTIMYFSPEARHQAYERLASALNNDGLLLLGAAETVIGYDTDFAVSQRFRGCYEKAVRERLLANDG